MTDLQLTIYPYTLLFKKPATTSRGTYLRRKVWFVVAGRKGDACHFGIGECAPLPDLSCDDLPDYEEFLKVCCDKIQSGESCDSLRDYPSIRFGIETALMHLEHPDLTFWKSGFTAGSEGIRTNGLIWMSGLEEMQRQINEKIRNGFSCIKLKISAPEFPGQLALIEHIRSLYPAEKLEIRVDANGSFPYTSEILDCLKALADLQIHSIEQPIPAGNWEQMQHLVEKSPLPIALDEGLIGINNPDDKLLMLKKIHPCYIILKPSLHGGISGCNEWIALAESLKIGWWMTSALESNIGLNAIAQFAAFKEVTMSQGLGTGALFTNNIRMPIQLVGESLRFCPEEVESGQSLLSRIVGK